MYAYIKGILTQLGITSATLEANGVGYKIGVTQNTLGRLPALGESVILHTAFIVREDSQSLYGFLTTEERELFEVLLSVNGVGPKLALALVGNLSIAELRQAILNGDTHTLSKVPGIGKRMAERLAVELKGKMKQLFPKDFDESLVQGTAVSLSSQVIRDAVSALINLGYTQAIAKKAIQDSLEDLPEEPELSALIKSALTHI